MKLKSLEIDNFRGIGRLSMGFDDKMTVILGRNGVGKSSILDAIAVILIGVQASWPSHHSSASLLWSPIPSHDIRSGQESARIELTLELDNPAAVSGYHRLIQIRLNNMDEAGFVINETINKFWNFVHQRGLANEMRPLMVYYRQDRGFEQKSPRISNISISSMLQSSLVGELQAISELERWWDKCDAEEARRVRDTDDDYRDPQLEAIRSVIQNIDGFKGISYSSRKEPEGIYLKKNNGLDVHVSMLSSGERAFIILLADLSRRLQVLHPNQPLKDIPGIVLIDEIELNLHPAWQSKILSTLQRLFPNCQFVISTHSPQVLSSVESEHVQMLDANDDGVIELTKPLQTKGQTSNYLLEGVFGSNERFPEADELIEQFNHAISAGDVDKARELFTNIENSIEGDPPEMLVFKRRLSKLEGQS